MSQDCRELGGHKCNYQPRYHTIETNQGNDRKTEKIYAGDFCPGCGTFKAAPVIPCKHNYKYLGVGSCGVLICKKCGAHVIL